MQSSQERNARIDLAGLALAGIQLIVLAWLCYFFEIGGQPFVKVIALAVPAFVIHAVIPLRYRLAWYLAVSIAGIGLVVGLLDAIWLIAVVCGFIGICHLPIALRWRVLLLVSAGSLFAYLKASGWLVPWSHATWPIIASILMFRLVIYLYDLHHDKNRPPVAWSLSYFFLLPNVCFPLFPVVDFKKFRSTYYSEPAEIIYRRGLSWIFRGIYQLLLYRVVYQFFVIPPGEVLSAVQLLQFMLSAYLLYLRVSGLFHLIVGMLLLFGFNLPETHKKYYLASSFNDFWRRINIYWKDFMMKIFYYPVYFKAKALGPTAALVIATVTVFLSTWALHAYQWFWLRGTMLFEAHDLLFWAILGGFVVVNSLREIKHGRNRTSGSRALLSFATFAHACYVISTFSALCILWSMWSSDSLEQWLVMWRAAGAESVWIAAIVPAFYLLARWAGKRSSAAPTFRRGLDVAKAPVQLPQRVQGQALAGLSVAAMTGLVLISMSGTGLVSPSLSDAADRIRTDQMNRRDEARMERGYYEHLLNVNRHSAGLWDVFDKKPADWEEGLHATGATADPDNILLTVMVPDAEVSFRNHPFRTNRWGMRDQNYEQEKTPGTVRMAFIGSSYVLGSGVGDDQVFEHLLEKQLNSAAASTTPRYEILNFAMAAYGALQQLYLLETKISDFDPDVVVYFQIEEDERWILRNLSLAIQRGIDIPFPFVREMVERLGLDSSDSDEYIRSQLAPYADELHTWSERQLIAGIQNAGAKPVCVLVPRVRKRLAMEAAEERQSVTASAGCLTINLANVFDGYSKRELEVAPWDNHPNALGHSLIAKRLHEEFMRRPEVMGSTVQRASSSR